MNLSPAFLNYAGSKNSLADFILSFVPPHHCWVEVFGGSGAMLFSKPPSEVEVYNDINKDLYSLFEALSQKATADELYTRLSMTLYSREQFDRSKDALKEKSTTGIDRAFHAFVVYNQSMGGVIRKSYGGGWSFSASSNKAKTYFARVDALQSFAYRLRNVQVECKDYEYIFKRYDAIDTLFYLDPPYINETRSGGDAYQNELSTPDQHAQLIGAIAALKGLVIVSGYNHPIYQLLDRLHFERVEISVRSTLAPGKKQGAKRKECLWLSPTIQEIQQSLF